MIPNRKLEIYIDGASFGNPGPAGIGIIICWDGKVFKNFSKYIGETSNNVAEYMALIYGLQEALIIRANSIVINTDSELLAKQINGQYKVRDAQLKLLYTLANHLISSFKDIVIKHIARTQNRGADKLANKAIKSRLDDRLSLKWGGKSELRRAA